MGAPVSLRVAWQRMKLQESICGGASTLSDLAGARPLGDAEQQADHQIAPKQPSELFGQFGRTACEQSGLLGVGHNFAQGGTGCLASYRVERTRHFRGLDHLSDRQPEYGNDRGLTYFADNLAPKEASTCAKAFRSLRTGRSAGTSSRLARSLMQAISVSCLLPTSA